MGYKCRIPAKVIGVLDLVLTIVSLCFLIWVIVIPAVVATISLPSIMRQASISTTLNSTALDTDAIDNEEDSNQVTENTASAEASGGLVAKGNNNMEKLAISVVAMTFFWIFILIVLVLKITAVVANVKLIRSTAQNQPPSKAKVRADFWLVLAIPLTELLVVYIAYQLIFSVRSTIFSLLSIVFYFVGIIIVYCYVRELGVAEDIEASLEEQRTSVSHFLLPDPDNVHTGRSGNVGKIV